MYFKENKGVTLMALTITIIVMLIITGTIIYNTNSHIRIEKINRLYNDIENISNKIEDYYLKYGEIPTIGNVYCSKTVLTDLLSNNANAQNATLKTSDNNVIINPNDGDEYYIIDLEKFEGLTLNYGYGDDYTKVKELKNTPEDITTELDEVYIINKATHQIYYPSGVFEDGYMYYSYSLDTKDAIKEYSISSTNGNIELDNKNIANSLKIYGNSVQSRLPEEYQEVEYIETDGNAYIDTGIVPNAYTKMVETFQLNTATYTAVAGIAGIIESNVNSRFSFYTNKSGVVNKNQISAGIGYTFNGAEVPQMDTNIHTFELYQDSTAQYFVADGTTIEDSAQINNANLIAHTVWVGYRNDLRESKAIGISHKIYRFSMYTRNSFTSDFTPQINLIPCYRKSDNVIGMYDLANDVFYTNAGTGTFTKGNDVTPTVEIQSVGDLVTDRTDDNYGKYKISIEVSGINKLSNNIFTSLPRTPFEQTSNRTLYPEYKLSNGKLKENTWYTIIAKYTNINGGACGLSLLIASSSYPNYSTFIKQGNICLKFNTLNNLNTLVQFATRNYGSSEGSVKYENFMILEGDYKNKDIPLYEPYKKPITTHIYLNEPLRKIGDNSDYIDLLNKKVVRNVRVVDDTGKLTIEESYQSLSTPTIENIKFPTLSTNEATNIISVNTKIPPSNIELSYYEINK